MNKRKQMLTLLCLVCGLSQTPAANAQADILLGMGMKLIPIVLPMVLTTIPMIPVLVKEWMPPLPRLGRKKKDAVSDTTSTESDTSDSDSSSSDGSSDSGKKSSVSAEESTPQSRPLPADNQQEVAANVRARPTDNSEWFLEDENEQTQTQSARIQSSGISPRAPGKTRVREVVKGEVLIVPAKVQATPAIPSQPPAESASSTQPHQTQAAETENTPPPVIMMRVSE